MFRRLVPLFAVLLTFLFDTAVLPVFYSGSFVVPLTLVVVILTGIQLGRMQGMLYGMIAGLLLDVSAGTLGLKLFPYTLIGFLIGFFLDQQQIDRSTPRNDRIQYMLVRVIWIAALLGLHEIVLLVYRYFYTAVFSWRYLLDAALRVALATALCMAGFPLYHALCFGRARKRDAGRDSREVKSY